MLDSVLEDDYFVLPCCGDHYYLKVIDRLGKGLIVLIARIEFVGAMI